MTLTRDFKQPVIERIQRDTVGFEQLAELTHKPSMDNLAAIFDAVRGWSKVSFDVRVVKAAGR